MLIAEQDARRMLIAAGFKSASGCDTKRLAKKLQGLKAMESELEEPKEEVDKKLLKECLEALTKSEELCVFDPTNNGGIAMSTAVAPVPKKTKPTKSSANKSSPKKTKSLTTTEKDKRPGVIQTIREALRAASKSDPLSKDQVMKVLTKKFPDREVDSMVSTLNTKLSDWQRAEVIEKGYKDVKVRVTQDKESKTKFYYAVK